MCVCMYLDTYYGVFKYLTKVVNVTFSSFALVWEDGLQDVVFKFAVIAMSRFSVTKIVYKFSS